PQSTKPSREEVARRGLEDAQVSFLLKEAEIKFGRTLKANEASTLVWLHDDEGLSAPVIIMLLEFAAAEGACNVSFIERTALQWVQKGVSDISDAEQEIKQLQESRSAWRQVCRAMGIEKRLPSANELKLATTWVYDYGYGQDILHAAYEACVDSISKFDMKYVKGIIDNWHKNGVKTTADLSADATAVAPTPKKAERKKKSSAMNTTDMDWAEKMLQTGGKD
ncbi:MAG: DnaD domain protein, partial [Clostridia bacterium]|nr:DnaD domain protein [Clostridia bacterium]